jgi:hypothetical protein
LPLKCIDEHVLTFAHITPSGKLNTFSIASHKHKHANLCVAEEASLEGPENPFLDPNNTIRHPTIEEREAGSAPHKAKEGPTEELAEILLEREQVKWQVGGGVHLSVCWFSIELLV